MQSLKLPSLSKVLVLDLKTEDPMTSSRRSNSFQRNPYRFLSQMSSRAEFLKQENLKLKNELYEIVTADNSSFISKFEKTLLAFSAKLSIREKEFNETWKAISAGKKSTNPTFIDNSSIQEVQSKFDFVSTTLLISNEQRPFFAANDIKIQNDELLLLISKLKMKVQNIQKRTIIYQKGFQHTKRMDESANQICNSDLYHKLNVCEIEEQRIKISDLQAELKSLIAQRKPISVSPPPLKRKSKAPRKTPGFRLYTPQVYQNQSCRASTPVSEANIEQSLAITHDSIISPVTIELTKVSQISEPVFKPIDLTMKLPIMHPISPPPLIDKNPRKNIPPSEFWKNNSLQ